MNEIKKKYLRYINKNILNLNKNDEILITGASGSIGRSVIIYLSYLGLNLTLLVRDPDSINNLKIELEIKFKNKINVYRFNYLSIENVNEVIKKIANKKYKYFLNLSGVYHKKTNIIKINNLMSEETFLVNYLMPIYFESNLIKYNKEIKIINVVSISYLFTKINLKDFEKINENNLTKRYAHSKRLLMDYSIYLKKEGIHINLTHPGISATNLFSKKHHGYNKLFYIFIYPLMKLIFMSPNKAALSILYAINFKTQFNYWIGPRGIFKVFGYPKVYKIKGSLNNDPLDKIVSLTLDKLNLLN